MSPVSESPCPSLQAGTGADAGTWSLVLYPGYCQDMKNPVGGGDEVSSVCVKCFWLPESCFK